MSYQQNLKHDNIVQLLGMCQSPGMFNLTSE
jgi:hypothetical protein